jgi:type II secretory ATPase GspE/PulE/Tfp pilus assembly ATPase PilB-like protein
MKHLIYKKSSASQIKDLAVQEGMRTLMQDGLWKIFKGDTDLVQLRRVVAE